MIAVITAGGRVEGAFAAEIGTAVKALASVGGRFLVDAAIEAARGAGAQRITIVGGDEIRAHCASQVDEIIGEDAEGRENLRRALCSGGAMPLLLMTSDMPFVTTLAIKEFLIGAAGSDLALPLAGEAAYAASYPDAPPHITAIGGERIANGNVVYFAPGVAQRVIPAAQRMFDARKSLWKMAALLGPALLVRFALRTLRIEHIEARAARVLGVRARAVRDASPSLCFDIDTLNDYHYALARGEHG